jgi:hypothetical protein
MNNKYRAEKIAEAMYICVCGDDYNNATIHDSMADARSKASSMNQSVAMGWPA